MYKSFLKVVKAVCLAGVFIMLAVFFRIVFKASTAAADSLVFYPDFCLGGWEKPQNASKQVDLAENASETEFTMDNSAFLGSGIASQIFCGYFPIESKEEPPKEVSVSFNWILKNIQSSSASSQSNSTTPASSSDSVSAPAATSSEPKAEPEPESVSEPAPEPVAEPKPEPELAPAPEPEPAPEEPIIQSFLNLFAETAYAQSLSQTQDFLDVSYSIDGVRWISVGKVSSSNFKNYSVKIPISSWEDLKKIQIMINVVPTVDGKPDIYLDGMSLAVDYDRPFAEAAQEGIENTATAVVSALDAVGDKIVSIVTIMDEPEQAEVPKAPEKVVVKEKKLVFEVSGAVLATHNSLPWYSDDFRGKVEGRGSHTNSPSIERGEEGKSLLISGNCENAYFVVLLWKKSDDYINRAGSFASNFADKCSGGRFSYDLKSISTDTQDGEYYLMIAEEDENNPWVPASGLVPIKISSVVEERVVSE